jgi:hypothetical protein
VPYGKNAAMSEAYKNIKNGQWAGNVLRVRACSATKAAKR